MLSKASAHWSIYEKAHSALSGHSQYAKGILLDIGCGQKHFYDVFQGHVESYIGLDVPTTIDRPDKKEREMKIDIYGDGLYLPMKKNTIDTVLSSFVIEHIFRYNQFFDEVHRVLKKGGHFFLISPLINEVHEAPYDYFRFTKYSIRLIALEHGFTPLQIIPIGGEFLFWGNRISSHIHNKIKFSHGLRLREILAYLVQRITLTFDNKFTPDKFVCNYLSIFQKAGDERL